MKIKSFGSLTQDQITKLESKLGIDLPEEYIDFLMEHNGGELISNEARTIGIAEVNGSILIDVFFGYETGLKNLDILTWMDLHAEDIYRDTVILANDAGHGFVVMICKGQDKGIWYWDASFSFDVSDDVNNIYKVCSTFSELLDKLN
jgi:hypothetical protein